MRNKLLTLAFFCLFALQAKSPETTISDQAAEWVESIFKSLTEDERIGQLMMIRAHSNLGADHIAKVEKLIRDYQVGGLCFFQGKPEKQIELLNRYQPMAKKVPMMVAMDAEWGLGMRMKESTISFPRQLTLGAIQDNRLIYDMGKEVAKQLRAVGTHINFAPVADVNNNPNNPVINTRSFGEDRYNVAVKSYMYMKGLQDGNVMACAKHFPGHGDTDVDSHYDLPVITHNRNRLDSIELFPFKVLAEKGIQSMMIAHLQVNDIDNTQNMPTTLSPKAINQLLKEQMGYDGLIFTDGLGMKGVTKHHEPGEVEAKALVAGNDVLLLPEDVPAAFKAIKKYLKEGKITWEMIDEKVKKILKYKFQLGLTSFTSIPQQQIRSTLNAPKVKTLKRKLIQNALTLVRDEKKNIPIIRPDTLSIASLSMGAKGKTAFQSTLGNYANITHYQSPKEMSASQSSAMISKLAKHDLVIVGLHDMDSRASKEFGVPVNQRAFLEALRKSTNVALVVFGNPYSLQYFDGHDCILQAYDRDEMTQDLAAQALFGAFSIRGRLPVTASAKSCYNQGITVPGIFRLTYGIPESVGLNSEKLKKIDEIANIAISTRATPGCVVLVAKDGKVVHNKAYGYHTYSKKRKMSADDIFDLASVTKIAAATVSVMKLHEQDKINIYQPLSNYLSPLKNSNKRELVIQDIMAHRAGLKAWIPFYEQTVTSSKRNPRPMRKYYSSKPKGDFDVKVTDKLFMQNAFVDSIWNQIYYSELRENTNYKYSDLGFYMMSALVNEVSGQPINEFAKQEFYGPLGMQTASYNPLDQFSKTRIPPTEEDKYFRRQRVQGHVHDMGAAMLGGVSGHAGLFASANDIAILMQMLLNNGYYGGQQVLDSETVRTFTTRHYTETRRGIGFDMKELDPNRNQNMSEKASSNTFGHLGFTGTCVWTDPDHNLIYVFLSNRTYPSMHNYKLSKEDYRPKIQTAIYEALEW